MTEVPESSLFTRVPLVEPQTGMLTTAGREVLDQFLLRTGGAGNHNLLMIGSPGSGKTMLSRRLPTILPELTFEEALQTTRIHSSVGLLHHGQSLVATRPFRSPHHTLSDVAMVGGGQFPKPGEVSLAHNGVLFLY